MDNSGGGGTGVNGLAPPPPPQQQAGNTSPAANGPPSGNGSGGNGSGTVGGGASTNSSNNNSNNNDTSSHGGSNNSGRSTPSNASDNSPGKLFVGGLSWQTTQEKLRDYFSQFGTVTDVLVMKDPVTQVSQPASASWQPRAGCRDPQKGFSYRLREFAPRCGRGSRNLGIALLADSVHSDRERGEEIHWQAHTKLITSMIHRCSVVLCPVTKATRNPIHVHSTIRYPAVPDRVRMITFSSASAVFHRQVQVRPRLRVHLGPLHAARARPLLFSMANGQTD